MSDEFDVEKFIHSFYHGSAGDDVDSTLELIDEIGQSRLSLFAGPLTAIDSQIQEHQQALKQLEQELRETIARYRLDRYLVTEQAISDAGNVWCVRCGDEVPQERSGLVYVSRSTWVKQVPEQIFPYNLRNLSELHRVCSPCLEQYLTDFPVGCNALRDKFTRGYFDLIKQFRRHMVHPDHGVMWISVSGEKKQIIPSEVYVRRFPREISDDLRDKYCVPPDIALTGDVSAPCICERITLVSFAEIDDALGE